MSIKDEEARYGVDIAVKRADDLDRMMIEYTASLENPHILDLGSGEGGQSLRLVKAGARVTAFDIDDYSEVFEKIRDSDDSLLTRIRFFQGDIVALPSVFNEQRFDACSMQRVLHYVPYHQAYFLLKDLKKRIEGKLYVSVSGLDSAIGNNYLDANKLAEDRFCRLEPEFADTFSIHEPLCLYTQEEFRTLLTNAGWEVLECWTSEFGNNKAICK
ncbi:MAG: SAM-dependent methyltransferase [Patiriisocius sp.]|jgi:SAM-dependent methyltransferase